LTSDKASAPNVELLNAHGPYDHSIWNYLAREETAHHRLSKYLVATISAELRAKYSRSQFAEMSIIDIGGYDGWILVQLQNELNFKQAVCVEPRQKNITKGKYAREFYGIQTDVVFLKGELDSLEEVIDCKFDFVLCLGVLHHVDSTPRAIRAITNICTSTIFISSAIIDRPSKMKKLKRLLNLKDISYLKSKKDFATAGFKFETPYFDGSTINTPIVSLPEKKLIEMSLEVNGFKTKSISSTDNKLRYFFKQHGELEVFISATKDKGFTYEQKYFKDRSDYEKTYLFTVLKPQTLQLFFDKNESDFRSLEKDQLSNPWHVLRLRSLFSWTLRNPQNWFANAVLHFTKFQSDEISIIQNISKAPFEKSHFEVAKHFLRNGEYDEATIRLKNLVNKPNCDWRIFYRSCYFLMVIAKIQNDAQSFGHYKDLLFISNPDFSVTIEDGIQWLDNQNRTKRS